MYVYFSILLMTSNISIVVIFVAYFYCMYLFNMSYVRICNNNS